LVEESFAMAAVVIPRLGLFTQRLIAGWARLAGLDAASNRARWVLTFLPAAAVMLATTNYGPIFFIDGAAAFHPAWHLVHHGHLYVEDLPLRIFAFVDGSGGHLFSNRTPGLIATAIPMYAALPFGDQPTGIPAAITTSLLSAASIATLRLILDQLLPRRLALYGALVAGFGTSLWSVAGAELLPHAPDIFWLTTAVWFLVRRRDLVAGLALMAAITTRPHLAVVALVLGLWTGWERRSLRPVISIGIPACAGLLIVMSYNWLVFGGFNLQGGYEAYVNRPLDGQALNTAATPDMALNVAGTFLSGSRGLLVLTPLLFLLIPGLPLAWRLAPWWTRASAVSGIAYTAVQLQIQSGSEGFLAGNLIYAYRYVLEGLFLCAPLLAVSYREWVLGRPSRERVGYLLAVTSVWIHSVGATLYDLTTSYPFHPWLAWSPAATLAGSTLPEQVMALILLATALAWRWLRRTVDLSVPNTRRSVRAGAIRRI
jgi:hypothetical protein